MKPGKSLKGWFPKQGPTLYQRWMSVWSQSQAHTALFQPADEITVALSQVRFVLWTKIVARSAHGSGLRFGPKS